MTKIFLKNAEKGTNKWWQYVLTILSTVVGIALVNLVIRQVLPSFKSLFPDNQFGKDLGASILIGVVFSISILVFSIVSKKLHQRSFFSFINTGSTFKWSSYISGFLVWGVLLFLGTLITDFDVYQLFRDKLNITHFLILFMVGFVSIGIQSFFEELVIRGYFLQGKYLRIKNITILILVNALIFGVLHFGYGIESFIHSLSFGIAFALIVIKQNRIEFVSGAHNANNLLLSSVILDVAEATNADFSWTINWLEMTIHLIILTLLVGIVYKFLRN